MLTKIIPAHARRHPLPRRLKRLLQPQKIPIPVTAIFLVLAASLLVAGLFLGGFLWAARRDQFEDKRGSSIRMLYDDAGPVPPGGDESAL